MLQAPEGSGFAPGDLVVWIVRRPDPVPCPACAAGEWDMCRTDSFGERGIVRLHGYGSEHWRVEPDFAVPILPGLGALGVLLSRRGAGQGVGRGGRDLAGAFFCAAGVVTGPGRSGDGCLLGDSAATR